MTKSEHEDIDQAIAKHKAVINSAGKSDADLKLKEQSLVLLGDLLSKQKYLRVWYRNYAALAELLKSSLGFLSTLPKAKTAKIGI